MPFHDSRPTPEFPDVRSLLNAYETVKLKYEDVRGMMDEEEYEKLRAVSTCSDCLLYEPCECEKSGVCDAVTNTKWLYDRDMHRVEITIKDRPQVCEYNEACEQFEPTYTAIDMWRNR